MNVYFREETYSKIKSLISSREISRFINEAVEEKLKQKQQQQKEELSQKLIKGYQTRTKSKKIQEMLQNYGEISWEDLSSELNKREKKNES